MAAGATIHPEKLLRELDQVWVSLGKNTENNGAVLRACAMTLIALVEDDAGATDVSETLGELMHDHPSRAIVVRVRAAGDLEARVFAQCWMPFGRRQQICCEQIEISSSRDSLADVPAVLRGLLVPDLPVVVWVRHPDLLRHAAVAPFLDLAHKVIVESRGFADWKWLLAKLRELDAAGKHVADLAWTRITRWRELIAQVFADPAQAQLLRTADSVLIRHSSPEPGPAAMYLAKWIEQCLRRPVTTRFEQAGETKTWQIQEVILSDGGKPLAIRRLERHVVEITAGSLTGCTVFRQLKEAELMREDLSVAARDLVFERVLAAV